MRLSKKLLRMYKTQISYIKKAAYGLPFTMCLTQPDYGAEKAAKIHIRYEMSF